MGVVGRLDQYASMLAYEFDDYSMSENLFLYSEQYDQSSWINQNSFETINAITSPDGLITAEKLIGNNGQTGRQSIYQTVSVISGTTYTFSVFLKQAERRYATIWFDDASITEGAYYGSNAYIDLQTGTIANGSTQTKIVAYPNGWYRCYVTATPSFTGSLNLNTSIGTPNNAADGAGTIAYQYTGDGVSGFYTSKGQFERGTLTDYTPTTGTAINRVLASTTNTNITGLGTYYASGFDENVGFTTFLPANIFAPYDPVYDEVGGTLFGPGQGRYMRQNTDKSVIVYNEIDEVTDLFGRGIVRDGLVLDLDAGISASYSGSGTAWTDLSASGNNGTLINMDGTNFSSSNGGYLTFDATNEYITSTFSTTSGQAVTYCGWLYSTETVTYRNFVDSVTARPMIWWNNSGQIEFDAALYTTPAVYRNQWVYVALSKTSGSSSASYYVNGVLVGSGSAYTTPAVTPTWFNRAGAQTWRGNCSTVQVYNRALIAAEVSQNYNALRNRFGL